MPIEYTKINQTYRNTLPFGYYDLIIISLVHQGADMVHYMSKNIEKYVKGNFIWVVHYNNEDYIDENTLPSWAWLVRDTIKTSLSSRLLMMAINQTLKFALVNVTSRNIMTLSSSSGFFREFLVPKEETTALISHELNIDPDRNYKHIQEIDIKYMGACTKYLESVGSFGWQYAYGGDLDLEFHSLVRRRGFKYLLGAQWSGQIWPYEVGKMILEDVSELDDSENHIDLKYQCEEIYLSTYAHNYAKNNKMPIKFTEVIIDWNNGYHIKNIDYIEKLRNNYKLGSAVCRLPTLVSDKIRAYL
jgi:hypothetical protein